MDNTSAIIRAMAAVPDIRILEDGTSVKISNKSILQKAKPEMTMDDKLKQSLDNNALVSAAADQESISSAYKKMMGLTIVEGKEKPTSKFIEVGNIGEGESDYFKKLVSKIKK